MVTLSPAEAARLLGPRYQALVAEQAMPRSKYGNVPVTLDGLHFDSKLEAARYADLALAQAAGLICNLRHHVRYDLVVNGVTLGWYESDSDYDLATGKHIVEDVKVPATRTAVYRLKKRLMLALYVLEISEWEEER